MYIDKYRPNSLDDIGFGDDVNQKLKQMAHRSNHPHLLLKGIRGSGKHTRVDLFLKERFGDQETYTSLINLTVSVNSSKDIDLTIIKGDCHYQIDPSFYGVYDKHILAKFVDQYVTCETIIRRCKIIVVDNADLLTERAQESLRRMLETNASKARFIFLANNEGRFIQPLVSRCLVLNVPSPNQIQHRNILEKIVQAEKIDISKENVDKLVAFSKGNLKSSISYLQLVECHELGKSDNLRIEEIDFVEQMLTELFQAIVKTQKIIDIKKLRDMLYALTDCCITPNNIINAIFDRLIKSIRDTNLLHKLSKLTVKSDSNIKISMKPIYHLECYCIGILELLNNHSQKLKSN